MSRFDPQKVMDELNVTSVVGLFHPARGLKGGGRTAEMTASFNLPGLTVPGGWWGEGESLERRSGEECESFRLAFFLNSGARLTFDPSFVLVSVGTDVYPLANMPYVVPFAPLPCLPRAFCRLDYRFVHPSSFGLTFIARRWDEHTLLKVGRAYERAVGGPQVWREAGWKRVREGVEVVSGWE